MLLSRDRHGAPMHEIFTMMLAVYDRAALMLICLFFLIRLRLFRELLHKSAHTPKELLAVIAIFSLFALFSTWSGVPVEGSLVNVRIIAVMSGGILFGPWVGAIVGVIAGVHRYLIDIDGVTAIPCFITSIVAGLLSGLINRKVPKAQRWKIGILAGMLCETLTMILVVFWAPSFSLGIDIVSKIGIPMILGSVCIGFIVLLVQSVEGEKEASAARQAKLALDIANKTLPLFRHVNSESLRQVCDIIAAISMPTRWPSPLPIGFWPTSGLAKATITIVIMTSAPPRARLSRVGKSLLKTMMRPTERRRFTPCWSFRYGRKAW